MSGWFEASTSYCDWEGTVSADDGDEFHIRKILRDRNLIGDNDFLIGLELYVGENHKGVAKAPFVRAFVLADEEVQLHNYDNVKDFLEKKSGPISVRAVDLKLDLPELIGLFKRFSVVLTWRGLDLTSKEYAIVGGQSQEG